MGSKSAFRTLTEHDEIRRWAEKRNAIPTAVAATGSEGDVGIIRLDFPDDSTEGSLNQISWSDWFRKFEENDFVLVVQERSSDGRSSNFNKFVSRDAVSDEGNGRQASPRTRSERSSRSRQTQARTSNRRASRKSPRSEKSAPREKAKRKSGSTRRSTHGQSAA